MVSLVLVICLADSPETCREEAAAVEADGGLSCLREGQPIATAWLAEHPKWVLRGWRCTSGAREKSA